MTDIFNEQISAQPTNEPPVVPTNNTQVPTELVEFVGEGKKYKTVEDALKSVPNAQKHILTLEQEMKELKEQISKQKATEELLDEIRSGIVPDKDKTQNTITETTVESIISSFISKKERAEQETKNTQAVVEAFVAKWGSKEKGKEEYEKLAKESGITISELDRLTASSPNAVFRLAGFTKQEETGSKKTTSTINTEALKQVPDSTHVVGKVKLVGASTKEVTDAWKEIKEKTLKELGL